MLFVRQVFFEEGLDSAMNSFNGKRFAAASVSPRAGSSKCDADFFEKPM